jgi:uncharacterized protein (TIGR02145 family)
MKKSLLSLGFIGFTALFLGCSDDATLPVAPVDSSTESSSSGAASNPQQGGVSSSTVVIGVRDTTEKHQTITVPSQSSVQHPDLVDESQTFCIWTTGCEATVEPRSSSSKANPVAKSSSSNNGITIDTPENKAPVINGMTMTDTRDNKTYALAQVGGKLWMAQDINYEGSTSECYNETPANCTTNGRLYTFNAAQKACPIGWHIPTRDEAQAAISDESYPWSYSGRCKDGDCNFLGQMGFHWTSATPQDGDKNFESNVGDSYTVIIVEKEPDYAGENKEHKFFQVDAKNKRFSVRCVQD